MSWNGNGIRRYRASALDVNQANTDLFTFAGLPARWRFRSFIALGASATPTLSTVSLRTAADGGGSAIVLAQPLSGLTAAGKFLSLTPEALAGTDVLTSSVAVIRSIAAAGGASAVDFVLEIEELP